MANPTNRANKHGLVFTGFKNDHIVLTIPWLQCSLTLTEVPGLNLDQLPRSDYSGEGYF
jgi:hypothetical protein